MNASLCYLQGRGVCVRYPSCKTGKFTSVTQDSMEVPFETGRPILRLNIVS